MKQCPICQSIAFDDADVCYGCLHRFEEGEGVMAEPVMGKHGATPESASSTKGDLAVQAADAASSFIIRIRPEREHSGLVSWTCTVDVVPA